MSLLISCSQNGSVHLLDNDWYISTEKDFENFTYFDISAMRSLQDYLPGQEGILHLKTEFTLPADFQDQMLAVFLGRIEIADRAYLNGELIGATGRFPPMWFSDWNMDRRYDIPPVMIQWEQKNELLLEIYVNQAGVISGDIQIGPKTRIDRVFSINSLFHREINMLFSFLLLVFGLNSLLLYSKRKQDTEIFWFALVSVTFAVSQAGIFITSLPGFDYSRLSYVPFMKFIGILEIMVVYFFFRFTLSFFSMKKESVKSLIPFLPPIFLMITFLLQVNYRTFYQFYNWFEMSLSIPSLSIIYLAVKARRNQSPGSGLFITALIPTSLLILHDMILTNIISGYLLMVTGIGLPFLLIIVNIVFGLNLIRDRNRADSLNRELDETFYRHRNELNDTSKKLSYTSRRYNFILGFKLSEREREVLGLIIDGQSNDEIAAILKISVRTVSAHLYKIYRKIDLHSRMEIFAAFNGITGKG